jgi:Tfp pilus assembly protein PilV
MNTKCIAGFSLVEVTIAIGIFAFVIVGIIGLFPVGLKQRQDAALETRAVLISRQIFESINAAGNLTNVSIAVGEDERANVNLVNPLVLGYQVDGTAPGVNFGSDTGKWDSGEVERDVTTKSKVTSTKISDQLYQVVVEVGYPAVLPADKRRKFSFSRLAYTP